MAPKLPIYLDYHATTPVDPRVLDAMLPYFAETFGNAASRTHSFGRAAEKAVAKGRAQVATLIGAAKPKEIVFTSGATESNNLALKGVAHFHRDKGNHLITTAIEHKAVLDTCKRLQTEGFEVTYLPVTPDGFVRAEDVAAAIRDETILVSVMLANNEVGTIQPIAEIGAITRERGVLLHVDAVQGVGRTAFDVQEMNVDLASLSAHKLYGPKGVGALYVSRSRPRVRLTAELDGGGHELGMRSGTLNVPGVVGFGEACALLEAEREDEAERQRQLRDRLLQRLTTELEGVHVNGSLERRLPNNLNISFACVEAESLIMALPDLAFSSGSACTSATVEPSHVLRAMGVDDDDAHSSIRFSLGRFTTGDEIDYVAQVVVEKVNKLRGLSPLWGMHKRSSAPSTKE